MSYAAQPMANQRRQWVFLRAIERVAPHVIDALRGRPFSAYQLAAVENGGPFYTPNLEQVVGNYPSIRRWVFSVPAEQWPDRFSSSELRFLTYYGELYNWQVTHNLFERWMAQVAELTLATWASDESQTGFALPALPVRPAPIALEIDAWDVGMEDREQAEARMTEAAAKAIRQHLDVLAVEQYQAGWPEPGERRKPAFDFVEWLVRYQCCGEKQVDIARSAADFVGAKVEPHYVSRKINEVAREIGLELRRPTGRRTYKGRTSS